jgi:fructose-1,6-bisphosphatase/inositol monophosphatase family enzyme
MSAFFTKKPTRYDIAAAAAIVTELGGVVTGMDGEPIDWESENPSYLAALDPALHEQIMRAIN